MQYSLSGTSNRSVNYYFFGLKSTDLWPTDSSLDNYEHSLTLLLYCPCLCCHSLFVIVCSLPEWKWICAGYLSFVYVCNCRWRSSYQEGGVGITLTSLSMPYLCGLLCSVSSVKMRGDCSFCWYWWNRWPSLFKLSFHKKLYSRYYYQ